MARPHDLHHHLVERLAGDHAVDRVLAVREAVVVAVPELEALAVRLDRPPELLPGRDPVHVERGPVGPGDRLVRVDEEHALAQPGQDLPELAVVRVTGRRTLGVRRFRSHRVSLGQSAGGLKRRQPAGAPVRPARRDGASAQVER